MTEVNEKHHKDFLKELVTLMMEYRFDCLSIRESRDKKTGEYKDVVCFTSYENGSNLYIDTIDICPATGEAYVDAKYNYSLMQEMLLTLVKGPKSDEETSKES